MALIDELQILITADSRAIESTLKKVIQTVSGTVDKINSQEVDWTTIFTRSVTPAVIAGVASMFAFAISNALQFNQALNQAGVAAGATAGQIGQVGQAALGLAGQTGQSQADLASSMFQLGAVFGDTNDQVYIAAQLAKLAGLGLGNLSDITAASLKIFKEWGVTTREQGVAVLTSLMHAAQGAKESIPALASQFDQFSPALITAGANLGSFNGLIATFAGSVETIGSEATVQIFQTLATSANTPVGPMELLGKATHTAGLSMDEIRTSIRSGGALSALQDTGGALEKLGDNAQLVATGFGFATSQVDAFNIMTKGFPTIATNAGSIATNAKTIGKNFNDSRTPLDLLHMAWLQFVSDSIVGMDNWIGGFISLIGWIKQTADTIGNVLTPAFNKLDGIINSMSGGLGKFIDEHTAGLTKIDGIVQKINGAVNGVGSSVTDYIATQDIKGKLEGQLTGMGLSKNAAGAIAGKSSDSVILTELINALKQGMPKSGGVYNDLHNTFNLSMPVGPGINGLTAQGVADQLYKLFQGTQ